MFKLSNTHTKFGLKSINLFRSFNGRDKHGQHGDFIGLIFSLKNGQKCSLTLSVLLFRVSPNYLE
jgi:hypothetical protein